MTRLRKLMLDELERRNYARSTVDAYVHALKVFAAYFRRPPDQRELLNVPYVHLVFTLPHLSPDRQTWIHPKYRFFLPCGVLSEVFRGKFIDGLR